MNIIITDEMKNEAFDHASQRMNFEFNRFNQNKNFRFNMILVGTIGELVFRNFLISNNITYEMEFQAGEYDVYDFQIGSNIIEIKTSGYEGITFSNLNLLYNYSQYSNPNRSNYDYVVQIFINGYDRNSKSLDLANCNLATISGYISYSEISNHSLTQNVYSKNYKVPLTRLKPITMLIESEI